MTSTVPKKSPVGRKIRLHHECPLAFLNTVYPAGVPVDSAIYSLSGVDLYIFYGTASHNSGVMRLIRQRLCQDDYPGFLIRAYIMHGLICFPEFWVVREVTL